MFHTTGKVLSIACRTAKREYAVPGSPVRRIPAYCVLIQSYMQSYMQSYIQSRILRTDTVLSVYNCILNIVRHVLMTLRRQTLLFHAGLVKVYWRAIITDWLDKAT